MNGKGGGGLKSLQVFDLDRLSYLTVSMREIGKVNIGKNIGEFNEKWSRCARENISIFPDLNQT